METLEQNIRQIVSEVLEEMKRKPSASTNEKRTGVFSNINDAVEASSKAFKEFQQISVETRTNIIETMRNMSWEYREIFSKMAFEETGMGRWEDKVKKNELAIRKTPGIEDLTPETYTDDYGLTLVERAPYGVIGSITPSTNPTATIISNAIGMISAGNAVVFNPHPAAKNVSATVVVLLNKAIMDAGGPENLLSCIESPTIESAKMLMTHPAIALMVVTGGPAVVKTAMNSGKKVIAAGPGNPPVVVDETADIAHAAKAIVDGASFDNNVICICEKEIIVVDSVADRLKQEMIKNGSYELLGQEIDAITKLVIEDAGRRGHEGAANKKYVGKDARYIAKDIGLNLPESVRLLICDVPQDHPLVWTEQLMPVMPVVRVKDVDTAIDFAVEVEHGFRHTAIMHSMNIAKLSRMAKMMNCSIFIKNAPSYAGLGAGGAGFTSFTIASPTGEGVTRTRTFTRERRCTLVDYFRIV